MLKTKCVCVCCLFVNKPSQKLMFVGELLVKLKVKVMVGVVVVKIL